MNKYYQLVAESIHRSGIIEDKNKIRQQGMQAMRRLIAGDISSNIKKESDKKLFFEACGF